MTTVKNQENIATIHFSAKLFKINSWTILLLPENESKKLPSRGINMVKGTMNGYSFKTVLEPDGRGSHWFKLDENMQKSAHVKPEDTIDMVLETTKDWIEPEIPHDMKKYIETSAKVQDLWHDITPMARWDWVRWVRAVKTEETRKKHLEVMLSKLNRGMRRPCCFNRNACSEPYVSNNWLLRV